RGRARSPASGHVDALARQSSRANGFYGRVLAARSVVQPRRGHAHQLANLRLMWIAPTVAVALAAWLAVATPATLKVAGPVLLLWFFAPAFAWWISRPLPRP